MSRPIAILSLVALAAFWPLPARAQTGLAGTPRFFVTAAAAGQVTANHAGQNVAFTVYVEEGAIRGVLRTPRGVRWDVGGGLWLLPRLGVAATVSVYRKNGTLDVTAIVPNPFFFDQPRTATASTTVRRSSLDVHLDVFVRLLQSGRWTVLVGAGPSVTRLSQQIGTDLTLDDVYPFDTVSVESIALSTRRGTGVGGNVSAGAIWQLNRSLGLAADLRWSSTTARLTVGRDTIDAQTGGVALGGGLRIVF